MKRFCYGGGLIVLFFVSSQVQAQDTCANLNVLIKKTYNFRPSKLNDAERKSKSQEMDAVWNSVKANSTELVPCLRKALEDPQADPWFRVDGSNLLVQVDPSLESRAVQTKIFLSASLDDINPRTWVETLVERGTEGFDVSEAGRRWLEYPKAKYYLPEHGAFEIGPIQGALLLFGSMDEAQATPALIKIVSQLDHPGRESAVQILMSQATPESLRALKQVDPAGLSDQTRASLRALESGPRLIRRQSNPTLKREDFLRVLSAYANSDRDRLRHLQEAVSRDEQEVLKIPTQGHAQEMQGAVAHLEADRHEFEVAEKPWSDFLDLFWNGKPTEEDAVAVLQPEDLPLLRKVRRLVIAPCNQHAISRYNDLTTLLMTLVWKPELFR